MLSNYNHIEIKMGVFMMANGKMEKDMENGQDIIIMGECFLYQIII